MTHDKSAFSVAFFHFLVHLNGGVCLGIFLRDISGAWMPPLPDIMPPPRQIWQATVFPPFER
jgi:hypothetical protein